MEAMRKEALGYEGWREDGLRNPPRDAVERELRIFAAGVESAMAWACGGAHSPFPW